MAPKSRIPKTQAAVPQAAMYVRVSTEEQAKSGFRLDVQTERCRAMASVKGWQLDPAHVFADEGISGTKTLADRPGLAALIAAVAAGKVQAVIVLALDRLGRKTSIVLDLVNRITACGVELVSCKESLDTSTPASRFVLTMFAALAQLERDNIVERTTGGRDARGLRDGEKGGRVPYGYRRGSDNIHVDEHAAPVVRHIFALDKRGLSLRAIAAALNVERIPTPQAAHSGTPAASASCSRTSRSTAAASAVRAACGGPFSWYKRRDPARPSRRCIPGLVCAGAGLFMHTGHPTIVVVDDDPEIVSFLRDYFDLFGVTAIPCDPNPDVATCIAQHRPAIVIGC